MEFDAAAINGRIIIALSALIVAGRLIGWLIGKLGQPRVLGEIVAGILLGPSVLGLMAPEILDYVLPKPVVDALQVLANLGLVMFMFLVGLEIDFRSLRGQGRNVALISQASMLAPIAVSIPLGLWLYPRFGTGTGKIGFCLFMASAISITAFPVLARLLQESGLARTRIGGISLLCAAINDILAWFMLAAVVAVVRSTGPYDVLLTLALSLLYIVLMSTVVRSLLARMQRLPIWFVLVFAMLSAWLTDQIGIHAIFGGFMAGAVMPRNEVWQRAVRTKLDSVVSTLLLPVFFGLVGLSTRIDQLKSLELLAVTLLVIAVATIGKFSAAIAAKATGEPWPESLTIGVLMNTRGLTEIIILTVGLQLGVLASALFTIMVLMALVTTFMAAPLLNLLKPRLVLPQPGNTQRESMPAEP